MVVTAQRVSSDDGLGFSSTIDAQTIQETPSVTRDIKDLIKLNPLVSLDDAEAVSYTHLTLPTKRIV